jgi:hypothetical protein
MVACGVDDTANARSIAALTATSCSANRSRTSRSTHP